jgi:hypothetical protein
MRNLTALLLVPALFGCGLQTARSSAKPLSSTKCVAVAQQRMLDARENGYDSVDQKDTFDFSYADCVRWEASHTPP